MELLIVKTGQTYGKSAYISKTPMRWYKSLKLAKTRYNKWADRERTQP